MLCAASTSSAPPHARDGNLTTTRRGLQDEQAPLLVQIDLGVDRRLGRTGSFQLADRELGARRCSRPTRRRRTGSRRRVRLCQLEAEETIATAGAAIAAAAMWVFPVQDNLCRAVMAKSFRWEYKSCPINSGTVEINKKAESHVKLLPI